MRACTLQDAAEVEGLRVAGWKSAYRGMIPDAYLDSLLVDVEQRRRRTASRAEGVIEGVAVQGGAILGWVAAGPCRDDDLPGGRQGEVYACYVLPACWHRGIGRLMMAYAEDALTQAGRDGITLWVLEANARARRFYESFGFRADGKRKFIDLGAPVPEVRYRLVR